MRAIIQCTRCDRCVATFKVTEFHRPLTGQHVKMPTSCWTQRGCTVPKENKEKDEPKK